MVLDAGGGGSTSRWTNWSEKDVPTMWSYVGDLNLDPLWTHSSGWTKAHELAVMNLTRLRTFRDRLAQAWPPEKSDAAKIYIEKLDELIQNVEDVYDAATTNKLHASDMALSLGVARTKLKPLYEEYQANAAKQATYDQQLAAKKQELLDECGGVRNRAYVMALGFWQQRNPDPAVASRQQELTAQARTIMWGLSTDLSSANRRMVEPPPYTPPIGREDTGGSIGSRWTNETGLVPPFIPTPVPVFTDSSNTPRTNGPALSGTNSTGTTLPPNGYHPPGVLTPNTSSPPSILNSSAGSPPILIPPGGIVGNRPPGSMTGFSGVIGAARPNSTGGTLVSSTGGRSSQQRLLAVNPVGGVITGDQGVRNSGIRNGSPFASGSHRPCDRDDQRIWDSDSPWEVPDGVPPVLEAPPALGQIDPGPAIGVSQ